MKLYSWNVNGIRAVLKKDALAPFLDKEQPDVLCLQETKAKQEQVELDLPGYRQFWYSADRPGYSGTAILTKENSSKTEPLQVVNGFPEDLIEQYKVEGEDTYGDANTEGRVIAAEFTDFWLVTVYTVNTKDDLSRLDIRSKRWDPAFLAYCKQLEAGKTAVSSIPKPVVFCGDLNVAHTEDDLANPKPNRGKRGFTDEERGGFDKMEQAGFVDTFRMFKQGNGYYSWWSHFAKARERNVGWRIDYFLVSKALKSKVQAAEIHPEYLGSDHCPVSVTLDL